MRTVQVDNARIILLVGPDPSAMHQRLANIEIDHVDWRMNYGVHTNMLSLSPAASQAVSLRTSL
jgi:hypothetical protein